MNGAARREWFGSDSRQKKGRNSPQDNLGPSALASKALSSMCRKINRHKGDSLSRAGKDFMGRVAEVRLEPYWSAAV
jgi:hypothetical protein